MDREIFFAALRRRDFPGFGTRLSAGQVKGINGILDAFAVAGDARDKTLAYGLATARREVGSAMVPVREGFAKSDEAARAYVAKHYPNKSYSKPKPPHGHVYYGRGIAQLTHDDNYEAEGILDNPDKALEPEWAAELLFRGLLDGRWNGAGKGIAHYLPTNGRDDLKGARRTVNVIDHWQEIGEYYTAFLAAIREAGGIAKPAAVQPEPVEPVPVPKPGYTDKATVARVQGMLWDLGYTEVGSKRPDGTYDGVPGTMTKAAILVFRNENGLPLVDKIDDDLLLTLSTAKPRKLAPERTEAAPDVVHDKVPEAKSSWLSKVVSFFAGIGALLAAAIDGILGNIGAAAGYVQPLKEAAADVPGWAWLMIVAAIALALFLISRRGEQQSVEAFKSGERR
jgi:putative chitinase